MLTFFAVISMIVFGVSGGMIARNENQSIWKGVLKYIAIWILFLVLASGIIGLAYLFTNVLHLP